MENTANQLLALYTNLLVQNITENDPEYRALQDLPEERSPYKNMNNLQKAKLSVREFVLRGLNHNSALLNLRLLIEEFNFVLPSPLQIPNY